MSNKIVRVGVLAHIDHGKTTVTASIMHALASMGKEIIVIDENIKNEIDLIVEEPMKMKEIEFPISDMNTYKEYYDVIEEVKPYLEIRTKIRKTGKLKHINKNKFTN